MQNVSRAPSLTRKNSVIKPKKARVVPPVAKTAQKVVQPGSHKPVTLARSRFLERGKLEIEDKP